MPTPIRNLTTLPATLIHNEIDRKADQLCELLKVTQSPSHTTEIQLCKAAEYRTHEVTDLPQLKSHSPAHLLSSAPAVLCLNLGSSGAPTVLCLSLGRTGVPMVLCLNLGRSGAPIVPEPGKEWCSHSAPELLGISLRHFPSCV